MIYKLKFGKKSISYTVVKSKRRKTSEIRVDGTGVILRVPQNKTKKEIENIAKSKNKWIIRKILEFENLKGQQKKYTKDVLPFLGKDLPLKVQTGQKMSKFSLKNRQFQVHLTAKRTSSTQIQKMYEKWLEKQAKRIFEKKVDQYAKRLDVRPKSIQIKKQKARWGSATSNNKLNLNVNLLKAPEKVIDYVVLHELCHFKIKEHNYHFWNLVESFMPNYRENKKWLDDRGQSII